MFVRVTENQKKGLTFDLEQLFPHPASPLDGWIPGVMLNGQSCPRRQACIWDWI